MGTANYSGRTHLFYPRYCSFCLINQIKVPERLNNGFFLVFRTLTRISLAVAFPAMRFMYLYSILGSNLCQVESMNIKTVFFFDIFQNNRVCWHNSSRTIQDFSINGNINSTL